MSQALAAPKQSPVDMFVGDVLPPDKAANLYRSLPKHVSADRFERNLYNAVMQNPWLLTHDPRLVFREISKSAALGLLLDPQLGEAYLIEGWNGKTKRKEPQLRVGYRGLIKLSRQSGEITTIYAHEVCRDDQFRCVLGDDKHLIHEPDVFGQRGPIVGYYAVVKYANGENDFEPMTLEQVHGIRDRSDGWKAFKDNKIKSTPWSTDEVEMAKKTVLRRLIKRVPQSTELAEAIHIEDVAEAVVDPFPKRIGKGPPAPPAITGPAANDRVPPEIEHQNTKADSSPAEVQDAGATASPPAETSASTQSPAEDAEFTENGDTRSTPSETLAALAEKLSFAKTAEEVEEFYSDFGAEEELEGVEGAVEEARALKADALARVQGDSQAAREAEQAQGPAKAETPSAGASASSSADPFAVPEGFLDAQEFRMCVQVAVGNVVDKDSAEKLVALWRAVKPLGADVPVTDVTIREMQALVTKKVSEYLPKKERAPKEAAPEVESQPEPAEPAAIDLDAVPTTASEYEAQLAARAALVTDWPTAHALKTWFLKGAAVRETVGLTAAALGKDAEAVLTRVKKPMQDALDKFRPAEG